MQEDALYLLLAYLILSITIALWVVRTENRRKTLIVNLSISAVYSSIFLFNLFNNSAGGSGLLWLVFLLTFIIAHWFVALFAIVLSIVKTR
jgi:hypothetical protein